MNPNAVQQMAAALNQPGSSMLSQMPPGLNQSQLSQTALNSDSAQPPTPNMGPPVDQQALLQAQQWAQQQLQNLSMMDNQVA